MSVWFGIFWYVEKKFCDDELIMAPSLLIRFINNNKGFRRSADPSVTM